MLHRFVRTCLPLVLLMIATAALALNEDATIVLHARDGFAPCDDPQQQGICVDRPPTLDISGMQQPWIFVMVRNFDQVRVVQCAFDWPVEWMYIGGTWDCQQHPIFLAPTAPGPFTGTLVVAFDCVSSGAMITIGRMLFGSTPGGGCLSIIESGYPDGTHVLDCSLVVTRVPQENRGRVCVGAGGYDACVPASTPVESVTWGAIKGQYLE